MKKRINKFVVALMIITLIINGLSMVKPSHLYAFSESEVAEGFLRVHFLKEEGSYEPWGLWIWDDVKEPSTNWPEGAVAFTDNQVGEFGAYLDIPLAEDAKQVGFLIVNRETGEQTGDMGFGNLDQYNQVYIRQGDETVYTNSDYTLEVILQRGELVSESLIELAFTTTSGLNQGQMKEAIEIRDSKGNIIESQALLIMDDTRRVRLGGDFPVDNAPYTITYDKKEAIATMGWRLKDEIYAYDGKLGLTYFEDGTAELKLWSPSADQVSVVLYNKDDQNALVGEPIGMDTSDRGLWVLKLDKDNTGLADLEGYYYHFKITRGQESVLALDPYALSMAAWNSEDPNNNYIGKAAIVNPSMIGPELNFADIEGYEKREDAIIYELHVRDFTSDPWLENELENPFGTFSAFSERLDYLEDLGVTHIQLLPVMSYFFANELDKDERLLEYSSTQNNYNWGYDPHSYFSLSGMYSENPQHPKKRIEEFKMLIDEIHSRGMGVILDVVYNHTARVHIFEDLEPQYYHFMDADGTPRVSFGGGRLGTTHHMSRRIVIDSIMHWLENYKVDGFRFDMMGDLDAQTIQMAFEKAKAINPNVLMIGEGWVTYVGDEGYEDVQAADQKWMQYTESVGSFSDDFRNELKSGFGSEGEKRFITGGPREIQGIFNNLTAKPSNFIATNPGDVVAYIAAHDNLTLHDVIAHSIKKDPKDFEAEIHKRIRLGNLMVLTSQGTPFLHGGQEYGRTKQFRDEDFIGLVDEQDAPYKSTVIKDGEGNPVEYPYFIHDSYDSSDAINMFEWQKVLDGDLYPTNVETKDFTKGLIALRRSTDAFSQESLAAIEKNVSLLEIPEIAVQDLAIAYKADSNNKEESFYVFINGDEKERTFTISENLQGQAILVDGQKAGIEAIKDPVGVTVNKKSITLAPLTATVIRVDPNNSIHLDSKIIYGGLGLLAGIFIGAAYLFKKKKRNRTS